MDKALLIDQIAELIGDARHVAAGALSPIPAAAAMLAKRRNRVARVSLLGSRRFSSFTDGGRELFDSAAQGRIDVFFLSGAEIDGEANINLVSIGDYKRPTMRFSGSFGSAYLYMLAPRVDPVPARTPPAHAGQEGRLRQRARLKPAQRLPTRRTSGADHRPLFVRLEQTAAPLFPAQHPSRRDRSQRSRRDRLRL